MRIIEKKVVTHHVVLTEEEKHILIEASTILWEVAHKFGGSSDEDIFLEVVNNQDIHTFADLSLALDNIYGKAIIEEEEED